MKALHVIAVESAINNNLKKAEKEGHSIFQLVKNMLDIQSIDVLRIQFLQKGILLIFRDGTVFPIYNYLLNFANEKYRDIFVNVVSIIEFSINENNHFEITSKLELSQLETLIQLINQIEKI